MVDLSEGWEHYDADRCAEAKAIAEAAIGADPDDPEAYHLLARCHLGLGDLLAAGDAFDRAIERGDDGADTLALRGWIDLDTGRVEAGYERLVAAAEEGSLVARDGVLKAISIRRDAWGAGLWVLRQLERLSEQVFLGLLLALIVVPLARGWVRDRPDLAVPIVSTVLTIAAGFYLGFLATPVKHLVLTFHPVGRRYLSPRAALQGRVAGGTVLVGLALGIATAILQAELIGIAAVLVLMFALPLTVSLAVRDAGHRSTLRMLVIALGVTGLALLGGKAFGPSTKQASAFVMALSIIYVGGCLFGVPFMAGPMMEREAADLA